jgi:hypothetical protein
MVLGMSFILVVSFYNCFRMGWFHLRMVTCRKMPFQPQGRKRIARSDKWLRFSTLAVPRAKAA